MAGVCQKLHFSIFSEHKFYSHSKCTNMRISIASPHLCFIASNLFVLVLELSTCKGLVLILVVINFSILVCCESIGVHSQLEESACDHQEKEDGGGGGESHNPTNTN